MNLCTDCQEKLNKGMDFASLCYDCLNELSVRQLNKLARQQDQSHLWPINGQFNATERAIRKLQKMRSTGCGPNDGLEYALALDNEISKIVNDPNL
jgi:hypothetical protein